MDQHLYIEQRQRITPQMRQAFYLLQMNVQELDSYMTELAMENPLLESVPPSERVERPVYCADSIYSGRRSNTLSPEEIDSMSPVICAETLSEFLSEQIAVAHIPELMRRELMWLAGELDDRGYLPEDTGDLSAFSGSVLRYNEAIRVFQSFEPAGVGARNLSECLCIQLRRNGETDELLYSICKKYLDRLARGQMNCIAAELGVSVKKVSEARACLSKLNPTPSNGFSDGGIMPYVQPDVDIVLDEGVFKAFTADRYMPSYTLNSFYLDMAASPSLTEEEREYFNAKLTQAKWVMSCIARRKSMLISCAEAIVEKQTAFFKYGKASLLPFTMTELAKRLDVYPSTISRAVRDKYLNCRWGTFPLSYFFVQAVTDDCASTVSSITAEIKRIIASENCRHPFSDQSICNKLAATDIHISRRTVAKYRELSNIPPTTMRRK